MSFLKPLQLALFALWLILVPIKPALISIMALPLIDLAMALSVARKTKQPITSSGLKRTVAKILMYETATILAFVVETYLVSGWVPLVKTVTGLIGMTELKSCLEHIDELGGNPLFSSLMTFLAPGQRGGAPTPYQGTQINVIEPPGALEQPITTIDGEPK
jgi:hypothetical protein